MTTNFGTKIAINAFLREIMRMWLLITGCFLWSANPKKTFLSARISEMLPWQPNLTKIRKKSDTKMAITSIVYDISMQFCFEIGSQLSANSSITLLYTRDKELLLWQPILRQKWL